MSTQMLTMIHKLCMSQGSPAVLYQVRGNALDFFSLWASDRSVVDTLKKCRFHVGKPPKNLG